MDWQQKRNTSDRVQKIAGNWHGRNSEQRRFLNVGGTKGWTYLLAIRTFSEREGYVDFVMGDRQREKARKSYS